MQHPASRAGVGQALRRSIRVFALRVVVQHDHREPRAVARLRVFQHLPVADRIADGYAGPAADQAFLRLSGKSRSDAGRRSTFLEGDLNPAYISAFAGLAGAIIGGLTSFATTWLTQRAQLLSAERELGVHVGASCGGDRIGVRAEADGIMDPMLIDERPGRRLVVHGKRRCLDAAVGELGAQPPLASRMAKQ